MKSSKVLTIFLFIIFALPIPLSLLSWIGTLISIADAGMSDFSKNSDWIQVIIALSTMLIAGTYLFTYIFSITVTLKKKEISWMSFLPILHIVLFIILFKVWQWLNAIY